MSNLLIFILVMIFGVLPLSAFIYWLKYKGTIIFKTAIAILLTSILVSIGSFTVGYYGIKHLVWFVPAGYLALLFGNLIFRNFVQAPIKSSIETLHKLSKGDIHSDIDEKLKSNKDETGQINIALDEIIRSLNETAEFANQVGEGNFDHEIEVLSESDLLRLALIKMREKLKDAASKQEEKRIEEEKRSWTNEGLAKLNEILRKQEDAAELSYQILSFIVNYLNANQGGVFIRNNEDQNNIILELKSFYAFNRRKYIQKTFELGEGLVGNCAFEKQTIHLTDIPDNYIQITSGMGGSNPKSLLLIPMKMEDEVFGVIEIASFSTFEKYHIEFVEQVSLSIASSLNMAETNRHTSELLERTQQQAEEMSAQEEEMRQNLEELQSTQEESTRKNQEVEKLLEESQKQAIIIKEQIAEFEEKEINWTYEFELMQKEIEELTEKLGKK
ncbi:MAG: GAF domain-containing protein [Bacteroidales bacterium]|nr:GAF domain-containing protein [Bacteroidales bacterium]